MPAACRRVGAAMHRRLAAVVCLAWCPAWCFAENWPRWRGPNGNAVSSETSLPLRWSAAEQVRWKARITGDGFSSPIVWQEHVFLTAALDEGARRLLHCLDRQTGEPRWTQAVADAQPERTSAMTGHAASTPVADGERVVAFFGNAGVACFDFAGRLLWKRELGRFDSELGLATSPIIDGDRVLLVCDHDGDRFGSFDSFLVALDVRTGAIRWRTDRPGLFRSWSTPVVVAVPDGRRELVVNAQDQLRGYDPESGRLLWQVGGMTGWVTPSPVWGRGRVYAASGRDGPTMAVRPGGAGDVTGSHVVWQVARGAPYVCSPLLYGEYLYVHTEQGVLTCFDAATGQTQYQERLDGKFYASPVAADGYVYATNEQGTTYVVRAGRDFRLVARNPLDEYTLASPAISDGELLIRTERHLYCITRPGTPGSLSRDPVRHN